jgi:hypothetical protein
VDDVLFCLQPRARKRNNFRRDSKNWRIATSYKIQNLDPLKSAHYFLVEYGSPSWPLMLDTILI